MYIVNPKTYKGIAYGYMRNNSSYVMYTNPPESFQEYNNRHGGELIICTRDEYRDIYFVPYYDSLQQPWKEIVEDRWDEMLDVMPPLKWRIIGNYDTFYVCEAITCNLYSIFARDLRSNKCWEAIRPIGTPLNVLQEELLVLPE
jgi:hypothetical protein